MAREQRQYTTADLYGPDGRPHAEDIRQDEIYNCYLLAPMGALSEQQVASSPGKAKGRTRGF